MTTSTAYEELLLSAAPKLIERGDEYDRVLHRVGQLMRKGLTRTKEETELMRLLALLIEDYDRKHALPPADDTPAERLQYMLEVTGKKPADLVFIFGQRSHVNEALQGRRPISADQARKLGKMFRLNPGYFI